MSEITSVPISDFFEQFQRNLRRFPDQVALQSISDAGRESFTYRQIAGEIGKISAFLRNSGIQPGDRVGILMENHPRWGIAFLAAQSAGAVIVPLDVLHHADTLAALIQHAGCKFLIVSQRLLPLWEEIGTALPAPLPVLIAGGEAQGRSNWEEVLREATPAATLPLVQRDSGDELLVMYTSGTTGNPKGVVLTHRNVYRNVVEILKVIDAAEKDHILSVLPLYHVLALMTNFIIPLYMGGRVTYLQVLEAQRVLKTFRDEGITIFICVPQFYYLVHRRIFQEVARQGFLKRFLFQRLLALSHFMNETVRWNPGRLFFGAIHENFGRSLRLLGVGGARFDLEIAKSFRDLGFNVVQAYGLTETAALVTVAPPTPDAVGSVGRPLAHTEIRIDKPDETGIGEVLIRGENVMKGYWKNPEATAEAFSDGWFQSGDLGYVDAKGCLHITGRKKDVIVLSSGKNIFPEEVEHFYQSSCPMIKELCVVGKPDSDSGHQEEQLHAVVVPDFDHLKSRQVVNAYDAIRWEMEGLSQSLPPYKRVRSFEIRTEALPRTTTRKIKRFEIEKEVRAERREAPAQPVPAARGPETPAERKIFDLIQAMKEGASIDRPMNLELDLGFSSLERVELLASIQDAFGVHIPDDETTKIFTVQDLISAVEKHLEGETAGQQAARASWGELLQRPLDREAETKVREILRPRPVIELIYFSLARLVRLPFAVLFRLKFTGLENLPQTQPFLICPNHVSYIDAFFIISLLPYGILRRLFILGDAKYFERPGLSFIGRIGKVIPIDPDRGPRLSLRLAAEGLRKGLVLCVFPEGERSIDGTLKKFRLGPAIVASELKIPVVPVGISGAWEVWPRGTSRIRPHPVSVTFGKPLPPPESDQPYDEFNTRLFNAVRQLVNYGSDKP